MDIVHPAFMVSPLLGAGAGYLVGGITGATAGFVIPDGATCRGVALRGAFMWAILAHPTPEERARLHDSMGQSTGIAWR